MNGVVQPIESEAAIASLTTPRYKFLEAADHVPDAPGLYGAIHGSVETWELLGFAAVSDTRPLYIGKAEGSLISRDLNTHFQTGCTGHSTLRRSLAALLRYQLSLRPVPRSTKKPDDKPTHFALEEKGDIRLTDWMRERLELAVWAKPAVSAALVDVEGALIRQLVAPLNVKGNARSPWLRMLRVARRKMAEEFETGAGDEP